MKKHLKLLLCLLTLACLLCVSVQAEEAEPAWAAAGEMRIETVDEIDISEAQRLAEAQNAQAPVSEENWEATKRVLKQGMQEMRTEIDISRYGIPKASLMKLYLEVAYNSPELFYVRTGYSCSFNPSSADQNVYRVSPEYTLDGIDIVYQLTDENKQKIRQQQAILEQKLTEIMQEVRSDWSDLTKAMYLHDYIAVHCEYDSTLTFRDAYRMLINGTGVCQGYTLAYRLLLDRVGIKSGTVTSDSMNHVWNLIQIDGNWYHVDVTWDDPTQDRIGRVTHRYFCTSEARREAVLKESRKNWTNWTFVQDWEYSPNDITADNTRFDSSYWANVDSAFVPLNGAWYYLAYQNRIMRTEAPERQGELEKWIDARWYVWGSSNSWWQGLYSGLSRYNDTLIYNTPYAVYSYDPENAKEAQAVYTLTPAERSEGYIYGTVVDGNVLRYAVQQNPDHSRSTYTHKLDPYTAVTAGGYAYYLEGETLYLKRDGTQSGSVIAAWYATDGQLLGMWFLNEEKLTANVSGAKTVKIFAAANTDYHPLCEATVRTIG